MRVRRIDSPTFRRVFGVALGLLPIGVPLGVGADIGPNDVGVVPPADTNCPGERIVLTAENERESNNDDFAGWIGGTEQEGGYTVFHFCRVDGRDFHAVRSSSTSANYAVLKLGDSCPAGSVDVERYFDNEDRPRGCPSWPWACGVGAPDTEGDYAPSSYTTNNLHLQLCMFPASASASGTPFPYIGIPYGVFGQTGMPSGTGHGGWVYTDDEDDSNRNYVEADASGWERFLEDGSNTRLWLVELARVRPLRELVWSGDLTVRR